MYTLQLIIGKIFHLATKTMRISTNHNRRQGCPFLLLGFFCFLFSFPVSAGFPDFPDDGPLVIEPPENIQLSTTQSTTGNYYITWTIPADTQRHYSFTIEEKKSPSTQWSFSGSRSSSETRYDLSGQADGDYQYRIKTCDGRTNKCGLTSQAPGTVLVRRSPSVPTGLNSGGQSTNGSLNVSWSASSGSVSYYEVQKYQSSWSNVGGSNSAATSKTISSLTNGNWQFRVRACRESWSCSGYSAASGIHYVRFVPGTPGNFSSPSQSTTGSYRLTWSKPAGTVTYYSINGSAALYYDVSGLSDGTHTHQVKACNGFAWACSGSASTSTLVRHIPAVPGTPGNNPATSPDGTFNISWSASNSYATYYVAQQRINGGAWEALASSGTTAALTDLANGSWDFRVKACNTEAWACSAFSAPSAVTQVARPIPVDAWAKKGEVSLPDATLITPSVPAGNEAVGAVAGSGGVSGGAVFYSLPITIPPGRAGMQPDISLDYSSRSGGGIAGVGWGLSAGGGIARCGASVAIDGYQRGVTFTNEDRLCLNGQRLIVTNGSPYGSSGAEYRTEIDQFARVTQYGDFSSGSSWFKVEHKNGRVSEYGNSADSRHLNGGSVISRWAINRVYDRSTSQNNIIYHYANHSYGEYVLTQIDYTGSGSATGSRHVEFVYDTLPIEQQFSGYNAGHLIKQTQLLTQIKTSLDTQSRVREYRLTFDDNPVTRQKRLATVTECAYDATLTETCLQPTTFGWSASTGFGFEHTQGNQPDIPINEINSVPATASFADFNGDGLIDVNMGSRVFQATQAGQWSEVSQEANTSIGAKASYDKLVDYNRDGRTDLMTFHQIDSQSISLEFWFWDDTLNRFVRNTDSQTPLNSITGLSVPCYDYDLLGPYGFDPKFNFRDWLSLVGSCGFRPADFNGDGLMDVIAHVREASNSPIKTRVYLQDSNGQFNQVAGLNYESKRFSFKPDDINGDGLLDLVAVNSYSSTQSKIVMLKAQLNPTTQTLSFVESQHIIDVANTGNALPAPYHHLWLDVNGDGLSDLLHSGYDDKYYLMLNTGTSFTAPTYWLTMKAAEVEEATNEGFVLSNFNHYAQVIDYNGDGLDDILVPGLQDYTYPCDLDLPAGQTCELWQSQGRMGLVAANKWQHIVRWDVYQTKLTSNGVAFDYIGDTGIVGTLRHTQVADVDSDGIMDVITQTGYDNSKTAFADMGSINQRFGQGIYIYKNKLTQVADKLQTVRTAMDDDSPGSNDYSLRFQYKTLANMMSDGQYQVTHRNLSFPEIHFSSSALFASQMETSDGLGGYLTTDYQYRDALYHLQGRGFQGFKTVIVDSPTQIDAVGQVTDKVRTVTDYNQTFPFSGQVEWIHTCLVSDNDENCQNAPISKTEYQLVQKNTANEKVYWAWAEREYKTHYDLVDRTQQISHSLKGKRLKHSDNYGNFSKINYYIDSGDSRVQTRRLYLHTVDVANWWLDKLENFQIRNRTISGASNPIYDESLNPDKEIKTTYTYNTQRLPIKAVAESLLDNSPTKVVETDYNIYGLPTLVTRYQQDTPNDKRSDSMRYSDDGETESADGYFVFKSTNALGHVTLQKTYPQHGQVKSVTDANQLTTQTLYDAFGRVEQVTPPVGQPVYSRIANCVGGCDGLSDNTLQYKVTTYQAGVPQSSVYKDRFNRVKATSTAGYDGSNIYQFSQYDRLGRKTLESVPSFDNQESRGIHYLAYDALGRLLKRQIDQAHNQTMEVNYQYVGHRTDIQAIDKSTMKTLSMSRTYNAKGQLIKTVDAKGGVTQYAYDALGNPMIIQDANGHQIRAEYDALGRKQKVTDPNMGVKTFTYTAFDEVDTETDANQDTTDYDYDNLGRLVTRRVNSTLEASFNYDSQCIGATDSEIRNDSGSDNYSRSYSYNSQCQPAQVTTSIDGNAYTIKTQYDSNYGRVKGLTYPNDLTVHQLYNERGYSKKSQNAVSGYVYTETRRLNARGQLVEAQKANGVLTEGVDYSETSGQMLSIYTHTSQGGNQRHRLAYDYDGFGNLNYQTAEQVQNNQTVISMEVYKYDLLHRLTQSTQTIAGTQLTPIQYAYDAVGNLTQKDDFGSGYVYGTAARGNGNAGPNAVYSLSKNGGGTLTYQYDANGNRTHENGVQILHYNAFNKPIQITKNGISSVFRYGADQMRYKQIQTGLPNGVKTTLYIDKAFEQIRYNGEVQQKVYLGDTIITSIEKDNVTRHQIGFVHRDRLGSVVTVTDQDGNVIDNKSYDPFGKPRKGNYESVASADLSSVAQVSGYELSTNRGYTDHEHLDEAELIHMNGRVYDYNLGRFLSVDPFIQSPGNSQSLNPYSYIMNNPLSGTDPSGYLAKVGEGVGGRDTECMPNRCIPDGVPPPLPWEKCGLGQCKGNLPTAPLKDKKKEKGNANHQASNQSLETLGSDEASKDSMFATFDVLDYELDENFDPVPKLRGYAVDTGLDLEMKNGKLTGQIAWGCDTENMQKCSQVIKGFRSFVRDNSDFLDIKMSLTDGNKFDSVIQFYNADGAEAGYWSHDRKAIFINESHTVLIGTFKHEFGHALGLPHLENYTKNFMSYYGNGPNNPTDKSFRLHDVHKQYLKDIYARPWYRWVTELFD
ncbi:FG-GAP-like repeat-containing protein [Aliikangiella sp. IMCC44359]|uniref:FG-GAP-like repeat-containing protein n=1 Tax=Aliikangiella sp. IMCC44359 TaxID=3459125 RepID=UPI00403AB74C